MIRANQKGLGEVFKLWMGGGRVGKDREMDPDSTSADHRHFKVQRPKGHGVEGDESGRGSGSTVWSPLRNLKRVGP